MASARKFSPQGLPLDRDAFSQVLLQTDYGEIRETLRSLPGMRAKLPSNFWQELGLRDIGVATKTEKDYIHQVTTVGSVTYGSELYLDKNICLFRAVQIDDRNLLQYFADLGGNLAYIYYGAVISGNIELQQFAKQYIDKNRLWFKFAKGYLDEIHNNLSYEDITKYNDKWTAYMSGQVVAGFADLVDVKCSAIMSRGDYVSASCFQFDPFYRQGVFSTDVFEGYTGTGCMPDPEEILATLAGYIYSHDFDEKSKVICDKFTASATIVFNKPVLSAGRRYKGIDTEYLLYKAGTNNIFANFLFLLGRVNDVARINKYLKYLNVAMEGYENTNAYKLGLVSLGLKGIQVVAPRTDYILCSILATGYLTYDRSIIKDFKFNPYYSRVYMEERSRAPLILIDLPDVVKYIGKNNLPEDIRKDLSKLV